jgi:hypothetical protein
VFWEGLEVGRDFGVLRGGFRSHNYLTLVRSGVSSVTLIGIVELDTK